MNKIGKYEFDDSVQADSKINALGTRTTELGDVVPSHNHVVVRLGYIVLEQGEYNESGVDAEAEVLSYVEPNDWANYRIELDNNGVHSFMGLDYQLYKF